MKRDTNLFAQDLKVDVSGEEVPYDTSHIYTGEIYGQTVLCTLIYLSIPACFLIIFLWRECSCVSPLTLTPLSCEFPGEKGTLTHGTIVDGKFEGFIQSYQGTYYVEPTERYLEGKDVPFHSVIYHEDDIRESSETLAINTLAGHFTLIAEYM